MADMQLRAVSLHLRCVPHWVPLGSLQLQLQLAAGAIRSTSRKRLMGTGRSLGHGWGEDELWSHAGPAQPDGGSGKHVHAPPPVPAPLEVEDIVPDIDPVEEAVAPPMPVPAPEPFAPEPPLEVNDDPHAASTAKPNGARTSLGR
jgi:hypothetical protein